MATIEIDEELKSDLMAGFEVAFDDIEAGLAKLEFNFDQAVLNELFRSIHSIKGNAAMVNVDSIVNYTHSIETLFTQLRDGIMQYSPKLSEAIHVGMDRLKDLHHREFNDVHFEHLDIQLLTEQFNQLTEVDVSAKHAVLNDILGIDDEIKVEIEQTASHANVAIDLSSKQEEDLAFFQELSLKIDLLSPYWEGRSIKAFTYAHRLNQLRGNAVSYEQLSAACYMHDFGMSFVPRQLIESEQALDNTQHAQLKDHPRIGYQMLSRISGWDEAATMVLQHQEHVDGAGYPNGAEGKDIHEGAKIIAIVDAYLSMTMGRSDRLTRRSALRAISEINARKGTQFDAEWVDAFKEILKEEIREGRI